MNWRLGLDLGTNSIGWCALELDEKKPISIIDMGVRIFPDGREPAAEGRIGDSLAVQRRLARGMRRRRDRHNRQKRKVFSFFIEEKLIQESEKDTIKSIDPYLVRKEGLDRPKFEFFNPLLYKSLSLYNLFADRTLQWEGL